MVMSMSERRNYRAYTNYSVEGNAARQLQEIPRHEEEVRQERQIRKQPRRRGAIHQSIDLFSIIMLTGAIVLTLFACIEVLKVRTEITSSNKEVVQLEKKIEKLKSENQATLSQVETSLDLNYIFKTAVEKLGMVYPSEDQVIDYESTLSDYVKQFGEIPSVTPSSLIKKILGK